MSTAIATMPSAMTAPAVTTEQLDLVKKTVANGATADELKLYLYDCARQGVHPLDKLIHFTKRSGKYTPVTSIDFMRIRAADTGEYAGSDDAVFFSEPMKPDFAATVTVWRLVQGQRCAFTATARWTEYKPDQDFMWRKMPTTMLAKCAEALALRKGFPRQLSGLYAKEELDQADNTAPAASRGNSAGERVIVPSEPNGGASADLQMSQEGDVIDAVSGEEKPAPPPGFHYIARYSNRNGWHEAVLINYDAQGGTFTVSTKKNVGHLLEQAHANGKPVKVTTTPKRNAVGEAYVDTVEVLKDALSAQPIDGGGMLTDSEIPF